jgi:hypothetical protein
MSTGLCPRSYPTLSFHSCEQAGAKRNPGLGVLLRSVAQHNVARMHARTRGETVEQDRRYDKSLAFTFKSE